MKKGFKGSVAESVIGNTNFRQVLYTGEKMQLVAMTLQPGVDIGEEVHEGHDQFFRVESGSGQVLIDETTYDVRAGDLIIVPSGANHNVTNTTEDTVLELYTIYTPPEHADGTVHTTKEEAEADDEHFDGTTTE
jgi:mannose-6-phosphate isomerase-like protein (cupin superfamily)